MLLWMELIFQESSHLILFLLSWWLFSVSNEFISVRVLSWQYMFYQMSFDSYWICEYEVMIDRISYQVIIKLSYWNCDMYHLICPSIMDCYQLSVWFMVLLKVKFKADTNCYRLFYTLDSLVSKFVGMIRALFGVIR